MGRSGKSPLDNPELAAQEIRNAAKFALQGGVGFGGACGRPLARPIRIWMSCGRRMSDTGLPFMLHVGQKASPHAAQGPMRTPEAQPRPEDWLGGGENLRILDYMVMSFAPQVFLTAMVFHGVFTRFPALRGGVIELGGGWVPDFLRRLDHGHKMFKKSDPGVSALDAPASEVLRKHVKFTPFPGEDIGRMIKDAGDDVFLFSSDYPHIEGGKDPHPQVRRHDGRNFIRREGALL